MNKILEGLMIRPFFSNWYSKMTVITKKNRGRNYEKKDYFKYNSYHFHN